MRAESWVLFKDRKVIIINLKAHNLISILLAILFGQQGGLTAQEVSISSELNIRNYYAYELLGKIDERYLVYRDKGFIKEVDVFNEFMEHTQHAELFFEKKRTDVISTLGMDSVFQIVYGYMEKDTVVIKMRRYNKSITLVDSSTLHRLSKKDIKSSLNGILSEDKSKLLVYVMDADDRMNILLYDNKKNRLINSQKLEFPKGLKIKRDLRKVILTNQGRLLLGLYKKDIYNDKTESDLTVVSYDIFRGSSILSKVNFEDYFRRDTYLDYDNYNDQIVLCGLYSEKKAKEAKGIYLYSKDPKELAESVTVNFIPFSEKLKDEVARTKKKKNKVFDNFEVRQIVKRQDGGVLVMLELAKEFSRRSSYSTGYDRGNNGISRGWVDYYNEDIIITSVAQDAAVDWSKILYKKQFSQDDEAVFSSFFVMKTPSRMRLIYNDEIKRSNTVSEYILDPTGKVARNSLLSTEDQNLKLRFRDALQISNKELLVPSENNFELNLVKISY